MTRDKKKFSTHGVDLVDHLKDAVLRVAKAWVKRHDEVAKLRSVIRELLLSADCTWEENSEGHDWPEACTAAREALKEATP